MPHLHTSARIAAGSAAALLALAGSASAATLKGVVVQNNAHAHTFVIANQHGRLHEIHARRTPLVGHRVVVHARALRNGTYALTRVQVRGTVRHSHLRGTVTYVSARRHEFVVSARGVSLLVRRGTLRHGQLFRAMTATNSSTLPSVGSEVSVDASLNGGDVSAQQVSDQGQTANGVDLEGTVLSVNTAAGTLTISADDAEQSSASLTVIVPPTLQIGQFQVNERVELIASLNPDGTYTLEQSSGDGSVTQAQSQGDQQGNSEGDQQSSAAVQCQAQQADPNFPTTHNGETFIQYYSVGTSTDPGDAFGRCVDATASSTAGQPSAEAQCLAQQSDPSFPTTHNGESFVQYYSTDPTQLNPEDSFGHCIDLLRPSTDGSQSGDGSQGSGSSQSGDGSQSGTGSQSGDGSQTGTGSQSGTGSQTGTGSDN